VFQPAGKNPQMAPEFRILATDWCGWTPGWTEIHSFSYGLKEAQVQA
jgi:hypothetical protein